MSYYLIVATAGHDTTSSTISGGMHALIENPDQMALLRDDLGLMPRATEEMIRWVTPVKHFMRTAAENTTVRGTPITAGESVLLSYASANRDEDVFEDPFRFDVRREPNRTCGLRLRRALLHGRRAGPHGGQQLLLRAASEAEIH